MFIFKSSERSGEFGFSGRQIKDALDKSQAIISFTPEGIILHANENFLSATGYRLEDIVGKHHSIFCEDAYTRSEEYKDFWAELREGSFSQTPSNGSIVRARRFIFRPRITQSMTQKAMLLVSLNIVRTSRSPR